jgi:heptosyltransferase I
VVRTLQSHWPDTKLTWVIGKTEASLVEDIPGIKFTIIDKSKGWYAYRELHRCTRGRRFDLLLQMQPAMRATMASLFIKAPVRLGFDKARSRDYQWLFTNQRISGDVRVHVQDCAFQFLEAIGITERVLRWDIPIPDSAKAFCAERLPDDRPVLAINPCSNVRRRNWRNWNIEGYADVADYAAENYGMRIVLTGGPSSLENDFGKAIEKRCKSRPVNLIGKTSLKELLAVLGRTDVLIAPDTGPAHMATAVGTPVIGLYATTNPLRARAYLSQKWVVNKYPEALEAEYGLNVDQAAWGTRVRHPDAMQRISVNDVIQRLDEFMAQWKT